MLKLTYTEDGLILEQVNGSLEEFVMQRVVLAMRVGQALHIEPGRAAFLIAIAHPYFQQLLNLTQSDQQQGMKVCLVDDQFAEVSIKGTWIADNRSSHEGIFMTALLDRTEEFVYRLWQATQSQFSSIV